MASSNASSAAKAKRYDRQLRIWGAHGQDALEQAHICLLNAGPTGSETLKNLVLGGIAAFTVVDGGIVSPADLGNNFLVEASALGQRRAPAVTSALKELNENVAGNYVEEDPVSLLAARPDFFRTFTLVVATQMREEELLKLESATRAVGIPLLIARSYGLMGYLRISSPEHRVVESKPDNAVMDLRFHAPWPQLQALAEAVNLATADDIEHKHVPYGVLLVKAVIKWRAERGGLPSSSRERASFKQLLKSWQRNIDGVPIDEENFNEAINNAHKMWSPPGIPPEVRAILQDEAAAGVAAKSDDFWVLAAALKRFIEEEGHGSLPLEGSIPDMTATTAAYLQLQRVYRDRADADVAAVEAHAGRLLTSMGRSPTAIPHAVVRSFCKNAANLRVVRYRTLADEVGAINGGTGGRGGASLREALAAEDSASNAALYLLLRAADRVHAASGQAPGAGPGPHEEDLPALKSAAVALLADTGASPGSSTVSDDIAGEMCRFGASELHCLGAIVGGMAAQEAIKLVTHQFVPLGGVLIYNAMSSTSSVFTF